jgi:protein-S-isoprenylcysteine O-methyltransferase Ste14
MILLARFRVTIGFLLGVIVFWLARPTRSTIVAGAIVASLGEMIRIWAAGHLNKSGEVTASGPYRWSGHPLYVGSSVMGAGLVIAAGSGVATLVIAAYLGITLPIAARREEAFLRRTFGDRYERYQRGELAPGARFSMARVIANKEHRALIGLVIAVVLLALKL